MLRNEKEPVRKDDFKRWLEHQESDEKTVRNNMSQAQRVERAYGRSLDDLYKQDELQCVLTELRYSTEDKRNGVANPSKVAIDGDLYSNLQSIRTAVTKYRKFCEAEHSDSLPTRRWGKFLDAAKQLIEEGELDRDEGYKDQLARSLAQVRTAFLKDDENWRLF